MLEFACNHTYPDGFTLGLSFIATDPVVAVFGPSGSGKTSILEMVAGLRRPTSGRVVLDGETVYDSEAGVAHPIHTRRIGMVFQDHLLFPHMTVERNLLYARRWNRAEQTGAEFDRVVSVLELAALLNRFPASLSGGESQRVALGRAMLSHPRLLLMDEPLAAIDDALKIRVLDYLDRVVHEWNVPAIFVSHSQTEVRRFAQTVVAVANGRLIAQGTPERALASPGALQLKDASGPVNLLRLEELHESDGHWSGIVGDQRIHLPTAPPPKAANVYVHFLPETVLLSPTDVPMVSARNHLTGTVRRVLSHGSTVFVAVDVGQIIWSEVTPGAVEELGIRNGGPVTCLIKTHSLHIIG